MSNKVATGSISVGTSAVKIVDANYGRSMLILTKNSTQDIFLGCNATTSSTSTFQFSGACGTMLKLPDLRGALWGICGAGSTVVTYLEVTK
jgi:hypothetical protein